MRGSGEGAGVELELFAELLELTSKYANTDKPVWEANGCPHDPTLPAHTLRCHVTRLIVLEFQIAVTGHSVS